MISLIQIFHPDYVVIYFRTCWCLSVKRLVQSLCVIVVYGLFKPPSDACPTVDSQLGKRLPLILRVKSLLDVVLPDYTELTATSTEMEVVERERTPRHRDCCDSFSLWRHRTVRETPEPSSYCRTEIVEYRLLVTARQQLDIPSQSVRDSVRQYHSTTVPLLTTVTISSWNSTFDATLLIPLVQILFEKEIRTVSNDHERSYD